MSVRSSPIAAALLAASLGAAPAGASERLSDALASAQARTYPGEGHTQYYYYGRGPGYGAAVGAGVAGLAAGALIGGAIANSQAQAYPGGPVGNVYGHDPNAVDYCARRYRSYDPASGTFLANDGYRYPCP